MPRPLDSYPDSWGAQRVSVVGVQGPASYTQIVAGTPPAVATGGQTIYADEYGLKYFDYVGPQLSDSSAYRVECIPGEQSGIGPKGTCPSYTLRWVVVATGAEAAAELDLAAEFVRLLMVGSK
jgi:hypothetical protein